jgi:replicative DNA helicase
MATAIDGNNNPHAPQQSDTVRRFQFPAVLQPFGLVDMALQASARVAQESQQTERLHQLIRGDLQRLRCHPLLVTGAREGDGPGPENRFEGVLDIPPSERGCGDAVLRYSLAVGGGMAALAERLHDNAQGKYLKYAEAYNMILGDLIPHALRQAAAPVVAERAYDAGTNASAADDWPVYRQRRERRRSSPVRVIQTGLRGLDEVLGGGLHGLTVVGGAPGEGKTTLAQCITLAALRAHPDLTAVFVSLEMDRATLYDRLVCHEARVPYRTLCTGSAESETARHIDTAEERLLQDILPRLRVIEATQLAEMMRAQEGAYIWLSNQLNTFANNTRSERVLLVIDPLQRLPVPADVGTDLDADIYRLEQLEAVRARTRSDVHPQGDPVLVISQVRKDASGAHFEIADLMGSAQLGYAATSVLFLEAGEGNSGGGPGSVPRNLRVAKCRDGGTRGVVPLVFDYLHYDFRDARQPAAGAEAGTAVPPARGTPACPSVDPFGGRRRS